MSTFGGRLNEKGFEKVCIDNFMRQNYDCTAFFLSHFHSDHMRGIYEAPFQALFQRKSVFFYCSELTRKFLLCSRDINIPPHKIKVLDVEGSDVELEEDVWIRVTWISSGHCPGSVMFLLEGFGNRILYSGDFRVIMSDLHQLKPLHFDGEPELLHSIYLDTTFASPEYMFFPSRHESFEIIKKFTDDWFAKSSQNRVAILPAACIGFEYLMVQFFKMYHQKIHVSHSAYDRFLCFIDQLMPIVTTDTLESRIHFCNIGSCDSCFRSIYGNDILLLIKPSALFFTRDVLKQQGSHVFDTRNKFLRVAYSSHASHDELVEFVKYLKPMSVYACVVPPRSNKIGTEFLENFLKKCMKKKVHCESDDVEMLEQFKSNDESDDEIYLTEVEYFNRQAMRYLSRPLVLPAPVDGELIRKFGVETPTYEYEVQY